MTGFEECLSLVRALRVAKRDGLSYEQAHKKLAARAYRGATVASHDLRDVWLIIMPAKGQRIA